MQSTDEEMIVSILAGEVELFSELIARYQGRLVNYLYRMLRNEEDAHDLAQEVFFKIYGALDRFDPKYRFSTWLFRVAQNAAIDMHDLSGFGGTGAQFLDHAGIVAIGHKTDVLTVGLVRHRQAVFRSQFARGILGGQVPQRETQE